MLFNSYEFIFLFLPVTFFVYFYLNKKRLTEAGKGWLVFSSLFFYGWWDISYLPLILGSILFNYVIGRSLYRYSDTGRKGLISRKTILCFGVVLNLSLLGYFKYVDFFIGNINYAFNTQVSLLYLTLPLAISFFTFQQIAYLMDSFRKETEEYDLLNYAVFVTFFPQLIAGPIVHHGEMMPQFSNVKNKVKNYRNIAMGLFMFSIGLFKKVVLADTFSEWATNGFDIAEKLNLFEAWATSLSYTFQLYFDFSGYADMAIGIGLLFNIKLPANFNSPYKAKNIADFWRRWHMTLTRLIRSYLWDPISLLTARYAITHNYNSVMFFIIAVLFPIMFSFFWIGLWHGAGWNFIFFGMLHGAYLVVYSIWSNLRLQMWPWLAWFITFNFVSVAWVFFRAKEWGDAVKVLTSMFSLDNVVLPSMLKSKLHFLNEYGVEFGGFVQNIGEGYSLPVWLFFGFILITCFRNTGQLGNHCKLDYGKVVLSLAAFIFALTSFNKTTEFLYFNF